MIAKHLLIALVAFVALAGCGSEEVRRLKAENDRLRAELAFDEGTRAAEIRELERRATIAQACDFLVPICPPSMVENGRYAIEHGWAGGGPLFWVLVSLKLFALGAAAGGAVAGGGWVWHRFVQPDFAAADAARQTVASAEAQASAALERAAQAEHRVREAEIRLAQLEAATQEAKQAADAAQEAVTTAKTEVETLRAVRDAMTGL